MNHDLASPALRADPTHADDWRIDRDRAVTLFGPVAHDWPLEIVEETGSTNADLMARMKALPHKASALARPLVRVAYLQTAGRGRRGRSWYAEPGNALLFSLACVLPRPLEGLAGLSLAVGVALTDALRALPIANPGQIALKWPNDVLLEGDKLAGILIETAWSTAHASAVVIGIGTNVRGAHELADGVRALDRLDRARAMSTTNATNITNALDAADTANAENAACATNATNALDGATNAASMARRARNTAATTAARDAVHAAHTAKNASATNTANTPGTAKNASAVKNATIATSATSAANAANATRTANAGNAQGQAMPGTTPTALSRALPGANLTDTLAAELNALEPALQCFGAEGFAPFQARWNARHAYAGREVLLFEQGVEVARGIAAGVDERGQLLLDTSRGRETVASGDVSLRLADHS